MNEQSSRSHAIVTVLMEQRAKVSAVKEVSKQDKAGIHQV
jgi:hypothetical protein